VKAHRERTGSTGLVFANGNGKPQNASNARRDLWLPLLKRAGVPHRDMYSLRSTFATMARASGEEAFNV
jgi:integrase